ncbi:MAG: type II toxin-antitoxin system YafQ family toxin [Brasilonema octagenarum HA4186-MV1]|nr:type II toxin-antitoxin system YafQ family toxin [Brasilonema octagenarum HA4186-MV1]
MSRTEKIRSLNESRKLWLVDGVRALKRKQAITSVHRTKAFRQGVRRFSKRPHKLSKLHSIIKQLQQGDRLSRHNRNHVLLGYPGCWECHIEGDWLLIYRIEGNALYLLATGSHADLF